LTRKHNPIQEVTASEIQQSTNSGKIPTIRFEDQKLSFFSGLVIFQALFVRMNLKELLRRCFDHLKMSPIFGRHVVIMVLIVHLLLGFRRLREIDYYRDDPLVLRLLGLRKLPDFSTISRALSQMETEGVDKLSTLSCALVVQGLQRE
jgi:hypothetical protein